MPRLVMSPFACLFALLVGCGPKPTEPSPAPPEPTIGPALPVPPKPPPPPDPYELDPAKHRHPDSPVSGRLGGKPFTPNRVELNGRQLTFSQQTPGDLQADLHLRIDLSLSDPPPAEARKVVVKPSDTWEVSRTSLIQAVKGDDKRVTSAPVGPGFALTLELSAPDRGKVKGTIQLALPGPDKSYLSGTFTADRRRLASEALTDAEVPYIRGDISCRGCSGDLTVGYVLLAGKTSKSDRVFDAIPIGGRTKDSARTSLGGAVLRFPKADADVARYEFPKLLPGQYAVYAHVPGKPPVWATLDVEADGRVTKNLTLAAGKEGTLEVKTPASFTGDVSLVPVELLPKTNQGIVGDRLANARILTGRARVGGGVTVSHVPPGKYTLYVGPGVYRQRGDFEVTAGNTTTVEISGR